jgi:hypothetical protein
MAKPRLAASVRDQVAPAKFGVGVEVHNRRTAPIRRHFQWCSFVAQCQDGIDTHRAPYRHVTRCHGYQS